MGYRGGAPSWVYKNQLASQSASYEHQISRLNHTIEQLKKENEALRKRITELEEESSHFRDPQVLGEAHSDIRKCVD